MTWAHVVALAFGVVAMCWRFIGWPYFPDDDHAYHIRIYAQWTAAAGSLLAICVWLVARRRQGKEQA